MHIRRRLTVHYEPIEPFIGYANRLQYLINYSETVNLQSRNRDLITRNPLLQFRNELFNQRFCIRGCTNKICPSKTNDNDMEMEQRARSLGVRVSAFSPAIFEIRPAGAFGDREL